MGGGDVSVPAAPGAAHLALAYRGRRRGLEHLVPVLFADEVRGDHVVPVAADQWLAALAAREALEVEDVRAGGAAARVLGRRTAAAAARGAAARA